MEGVEKEMNKCVNCGTEIIDYKDIEYCPKCKIRKDKIRIKSDSLLSINSSKTHREVLIRDNFKCVNCGKDGEVIHHIYPKGRGGKDEKNNLVTLCLKCHEMVHQMGHITISLWIKHFKLILGKKD